MISDRSSTKGVEPSGVKSSRDAVRKRLVVTGRPKSCGSDTKPRASRRSASSWPATPVETARPTRLRLSRSTTNAGRTCRFASVGPTSSLSRALPSSSTTSARAEPSRYRSQSRYENCTKPRAWGDAIVPSPLRRRSNRVSSGIGLVAVTSPAVSPVPFPVRSVGFPANNGVIARSSAAAAWP